MLRNTLPSLFMLLASVVIAPPLFAAPTLESTPPAVAVEGTSLDIPIDLNGRLSNSTRYDVHASFAGASININTNASGISYVATFIATPSGFQSLDLELHATDTRREAQLLNNIATLEASIQIFKTKSFNGNSRLMGSAIPFGIEFKR